MSQEAKVKKMVDKIKYDAYDLVDLVHELVNRYDSDDEIDTILDDLANVKDDVVKVINKLRKELK